MGRARRGRRDMTGLLGDRCTEGLEIDRLPGVALSTRCPHPMASPVVSWRLVSPPVVLGMQSPSTFTSDCGHFREAGFDSRRLHHLFCCYINNLPQNRVLPIRFCAESVTTVGPPSATEGVTARSRRLCHRAPSRTLM